ncbi:FUSC family protein [Vagococcus lutrae]|uniref:FUSC family protein n=1 Tax=Vagococcus lutrae TaxID=81947 RepID=UPI00201048A5|nr:FUSC family protein [Vagococcus lutrae]MDT2816624.1 FUSC family protein [Vagococcus lutrae]UQF10953.1 FUSC family protein [Vagococcus lutrae]UQF22817.1 FUSC family protein [Vagococcus lutrae]UQF63262.1 FUSC family protein [Vagococcus lutrae]
MNLKEKSNLDINSIKKAIRTSETTHERKLYIYALVLKSLKILVSSVLLITLITTLFGNESSAFAVVLFCLWLTLKNINFGYRFSTSLIILFITIFLLLVSPIMYQLTTPGVGFLINLCSLFTIYLLTVKNPMTGNAGLISFSYIFLLEAQTVKIGIQNLILLGIVSYLLLAVTLYRYHRHENDTVSFWKNFRDNGTNPDKIVWLLQLSFGISLIFYLGHSLGLEKFVWVGFAYSSLISTTSKDIKKRFKDRLSGVLLGSLVYMLLSLVFGEVLLSKFSLIVGLVLGMSGTYKYQSFFNTLGALFIAGTLYGGVESSILRVVNNFLGLIIGLIYFYFSTTFFKFLKRKSGKEA